MKFLKTAFLLPIFMCLIMPSILFAASLGDVVDDAKDGSFSKVSFIEAMIVAANSGDNKGQVESALASYIEASGPTAGKEVKQIEGILKSMKSGLLKQYWPGSDLKATLSEGKFDPLWGTALFVDVLMKSKFNVKLIETPANFLIAYTEGGQETLFDIFLGKDPIKTNFNDYISKSAGLRSSFQVKKFPPFNLSSAKRHDPARLIVGFLGKRLLDNISSDKLDDYSTVITALNSNFKEVIIEQDKIVDALTKKLESNEDPDAAIKLVKIADDTNKMAQVDTKTMRDNMVLTARKAYLAIKAEKNSSKMEKYLTSMKPLLAKDVYLPMAKEGYLNIHNEYWAKKDYVKSQGYAYKLYKELGIEKAKPFWEKAILFIAQDQAKNKQYDAAMKTLAPLFKEDKKHENASKIREWIYQTQYNDYKEKNDFPKMLETLAVLRKYDPNNEDYEKGMIRTYWIWAKSFLDNKDFDQGIKKSLEGLAKFPKNEVLGDLAEQAYWNYAVVLDKSGNREGAIKKLKEANDKFGDANQQRNTFIADLYLRLSINAANSGDLSGAKTYAEKGLIYDPENANLLAQQENLKRGKGSVEEEKIDYAPWE